MTEQLLGPLAALALSLIINGLFQVGKILPRNTVPREDYDKMVEVNATQAEGMKSLTAAVNELVVAVREVQKNGGL